MNIDKNAFTLAEVVITLSIIGITAAIVIPAIIKNETEKITVVKVKKMYSTLTNAYTQAQIENGPVYSWDIGTSEGSADGAKIIVSRIKPYLKIKKDCGINDLTCFSTSVTSMSGSDGSWVKGIGNSKKSWYRIQFYDGTSMSIYSKGNTDCRTSGLNCLTMEYDVNGLKGPNKLGVDIFGFGVKSDMSGGTVYAFKNESACKYNGTDSINGGACSLWVLVKGNMDYLKRDIADEYDKLSN